MLKKGAWFVFSTEHPFFRYTSFDMDNYFLTKKVETTWSGFGEEVIMPSYYHSLSSIKEALENSGFVIESIVGPKPTRAFEKVNKKSYDDLMKFPLYVCFKAVKVK